MKHEGVTETRLKLLNNITGSFRPGVLTALMGVSGAGKTTLMDVLAGQSFQVNHIVCNCAGMFGTRRKREGTPRDGTAEWTVLLLAGRKTGGYIEGGIRISGYPKNQTTFARIAGYCEQNDIHSPQLDVRESLLYSAWLRLSPDISDEDKLVCAHNKCPSTFSYLEFLFDKIYILAQ